MCHILVPDMSNHVPAPAIRVSNRCCRILHHIRDSDVSAVQFVQNLTYNHGNSKQKINKMLDKYFVLLSIGTNLSY